MAKEREGAAFPHAFTDLFGNDVYSTGMSLRDWFAGQALTGLLSWGEGPKSSDWANIYAVDAYELADAMLKRREKENDRP